MPNSNQRRAEILGMPFGTACNKLRRMVLFHLLLRHQENVCFKCGNLILKAEDLSLERKEAWQDAGAHMFWDLDNIAFSHRQCNLPKGIVKREIVDGLLWCSNCKQYKSVSSFHREKKRRRATRFFVKAVPTPRDEKLRLEEIVITAGP